MNLLRYIDKKIYVFRVRFVHTEQEIREYVAEGRRKGYVVLESEEKPSK